MWGWQRTEHEVGPFLFVIKSDPQDEQKTLKKVSVRCEYKGEVISDNFLLTQSISESRLIAMLHQHSGMDRPWFDSQGNVWGRLIFANARVVLCKRMAEEIARHWLYEATGYELQHLSGSGYLKIQEWFLENSSQEV